MIDRTDRLSQLAEAASELSGACIRMSRYERGSNPPGRSAAELEKDIVKGLTDVWLHTKALPYRPDWELMARREKQLEQETEKTHVREVTI